MNKASAPVAIAKSGDICLPQSIPNLTVEILSLLTQRHARKQPVKGTTSSSYLEHSWWSALVWKSTSQQLSQKLCHVRAERGGWFSLVQHRRTTHTLAGKSNCLSSTEVIPSDNFFLENILLNPHHPFQNLCIPTLPVQALWKADGERMMVCVCLCVYVCE